jgi:hypothetical protein
MKRLTTSSFIFSWNIRGTKEGLKLLNSARSIKVQLNTEFVLKIIENAEHKDDLLIDVYSKIYRVWGWIKIEKYYLIRFPIRFLKSWILTTFFLNHKRQVLIQ